MTHDFLFLFYSYLWYNKYKLFLAPGEATIYSNNNNNKNDQKI